MTEVVNCVTDIRRTLTVYTLANNLWIPFMS